MPLAYYNEIDPYAAAWLRAYGNTIVPQAAAELIVAAFEAIASCPQ